MTEFVLAFLCRLLKKYKIHKFVKIEIAGGGTAAIILQCVDLLGIVDFKMNSADYSELFLFLFITWSYMPDEKQLDGCKSVIKIYYSEKLTELLIYLYGKQRMN